jgi:hypothetical protein
MTNNNEGKRTWEDVLPKNLGEHGTVELCADYLKVAEKDGVVCLNPPSEEEIIEILNKLFDEKEGSWNCDATDIAEAISQRIRGK